MTLAQRIYGQLPNGQEVEAYLLKNEQGMSVEFLNYGGIITRILVPDKEEKIQNIVLGHQSLAPYLADKAYLGALIGRFANRIGKGSFFLEGKKYQLSVNHGNHHLHGGFIGYDKVIWDCEPIKDSASIAVKLTYSSPHLEEGFPGNLKLSVTYRLTHNNQFHVSYEAQTDRATPVNLTQHTYFNLSGNVNETIFDHRLAIFADLYLETDKALIPTGKLLTVDNTAYDFRVPRDIWASIIRNNSAEEKIRGYDLCYALTPSKGDLQLAARLVHPNSGRVLEVKTNTPGIQFYTPSHLAAPFVNYGGLCLETQFFPDSPNQPNFPSTILMPGEIFLSETQFNFLVL